MVLVIELWLSTASHKLPLSRGIHCRTFFHRCHKLELCRQKRSYWLKFKCSSFLCKSELGYLKSLIYKNKTKFFQPECFTVKFADANFPPSYGWSTNSSVLAVVFVAHWNSVFRRVFIAKLHSFVFKLCFSYFVFMVNPYNINVGYINYFI